MKYNVKIQQKEKGKFLLLSPLVGYFFSHHSPPSWVSQGGRLGKCRRLDEVFELCLPPGLQGWVEEVYVPQGFVEVGSPLFCLSQRFLPEGAKKEVESSSALQEGECFLPSPMDGIFYRRPRPEEPPFVKEGDKVHPGDVLGLVEVMKTFYPLTLERETPVIVLEFLIEDGGEVKEGQPIARVQPL